MEMSMISDAQQQEMNLQFEFQSKPDKLIVSVKSSDSQYQGQIIQGPGINFDQIKESLTNRDFMISSTKNNTLKLLVGDMTFRFPEINEEKIISSLRKRIMELQTSNVGLIGKQTQKILQISDLTMNIWSDSDLLKKVTDYREEYQRKLKQIEVGKQWNIKGSKAEKFEGEKNMIENEPILNIEDIEYLEMENMSAGQSREKKVDLKSQLHEHSKVVTQQKENENISNFFPKIIKGYQLLYRASQNDFLVSEFQKKCDRIPNTLLLITTEFGKKIGGFTPLKWDHSSSSKMDYKRDDSGESFIFSLTYNEKFTLKDKDTAIKNMSFEGPIFGSGFDLFVNDKANVKGLSFAWLGKSYEHANYKNGTEEAYARFHGDKNNSMYFKIVEWEVWKVEFEKQEELV